MNKLTTSLYVLVAVSAVNTAFATGDPAAGKLKAAVCAACHGVTGTSAADIWPSLAGQRYGYLAKQLKAFRDGTRRDPVMEPLSKPLSDQDIVDLAAYYATQASVATQSSRTSAPQASEARPPD